MTRAEKRMRLLLMGGIAGPLVFALVATAAATLRPDYRHLEDTISELGADGTPYAGFMNYAGFASAGLMSCDPGCPQSGGSIEQVTMRSAH
jgi:hypothetical membrane protein